MLSKLKLSYENTKMCHGIFFLRYGKVLEKVWNFFWPIGMNPDVLNPMIAKIAIFLISDPKSSGKDIFYFILRTFSINGLYRHFDRLFWINELQLCLATNCWQRKNDSLTFIKNPWITSKSKENVVMFHCFSNFEGKKCLIC